MAQNYVGGDSIVRSNREQDQFVPQDIPVSKRLGLHSVMVPVGKLGRLFNDGAYVRDLEPGRHRWFNPFAKFTLSAVDARVRLFEMEAQGTVPGPVDPDGALTPRCKVTVPLKLSLQLANIDTFLNTDQPIGLLVAMIGNHVTASIGKLRWDQFNDWVIRLRDDLERYLQYNSVPRTGLSVLEVFVDEAVGQTEADKRQLKLYQKVTEVRVHLEQARGRNTERVESAEASAKAAETLGVHAGLIELAQTPEGVRLIEADIELRKMAISAGVISGDAQMITTMLPPPAPGAAPSPGAPGGYAHEWNTVPPPPARITSPVPGSPSAPTGPLSQPIPGIFEDATNPPRTPPSPAASAAPQSISPERLQGERERLPAQGYTIHETQAMVEDATGQTVRGYEFVLIAAADGARIVFDLTPGYPTLAPVVWIKYSDGSPTMPYRGPAIRNWSAAMWLSDVLREIASASHS